MGFRSRISKCEKFRKRGLPPRPDLRAEAGGPRAQRRPRRSRAIDVRSAHTSGGRKRSVRAGALSEALAKCGHHVGRIAPSSRSAATMSPSRAPRPHGARRRALAQVGADALDAGDALVGKGAQGCLGGDGKAAAPEGGAVVARREGIGHLRPRGAHAHGKARGDPLAMVTTSGHAEMLEPERRAAPVDAHWISSHMSRAPRSW